MDGPSWGGFATGGAWLATHLWEHYLFTGDQAFLREHYPVMKGAAEFFLDFLVPHPTHGWLVTNPSTSPENFPLAPGNDRFFDEVTGSMSPGHVAGGRLDHRHADPARPVRRRGRGRFGPRRRSGAAGAGPGGSRAARADAGGQRRATCRSGSTTGVSGRRATATSRTSTASIPGHQISLRRTPRLAAAARVVLEQRGLPGNGWASAWKAAGWARLGDAAAAMENVAYAVQQLHDQQPVLHLLEGHAGGRLVRA